MQRTNWKRFLAALMALLLFVADAPAILAEAADKETIATEQSVSGSDVVEEELLPQMAAENSETEALELSLDETIAVDISANLLQKGGFLKDTSVGEDGIYDEELEQYLAADDKTLKNAKAVIMAAYDDFETQCDLSKFKLTANELNGVISDILNTEPKYFYVNGQYYYTYNSYTGYVIGLSNIIYDYSEKQATKMLAAYEAAVEKALSGASMDWSDMEKALYINDYLARNCEYDTSYSNYTAYDALVNQVAVCQGYALACLELADRLGLTCEVVTSDSLWHAWNMIQVNGEYYHLDVTWNDPVNDYIGRANHIYLMKSKDYFCSEEAGHMKEDDWVVTGGLTGADASDTSYDNFFWNISDTGFDYIDGYWYGFDGQETITKYSCDGTSFYAEEYLVDIADTWYVTGTESYYQIKFPGFGSYNGILYISVPDAIFSYNLSTDDLIAEYVQTEEENAEGSIYGMYVNPEGKIYFQRGLSYNEPGKIYGLVDGCVEYTITYQLDGGTNHKLNPGAYTQNSQTIVLKNPTRTGYTFGGWYLDSAYKNKVTQIGQGSTGNLTLYAKWKVNKYNIKFAGNGATGGKMTNLTNRKYGTSYKLTANKFERKGYTFKNWNTKKNGKGKTYKDKASVKNLASANGKTVTLYAQWKKESYKITYKLNGGTNKSSNPKKYNVTTKTIILKEPTRKGYIFKGWYKDSKFKKRVKQIKKGSTGNITLYAKWEKKK